MYAYCVREFSKKTAVSHDRAGFESFTNRKKLETEKNYEQESYLNVSTISMNTCKTRSERPQVCECKCRVLLFY